MSGGNVSKQCFTETDPFERAWARLVGMSAMLVTARAAKSSALGPPTGKVEDQLLYFLETAIDDVKRDLCLVRDPREDA